MNKSKSIIVAGLLTGIVLIGLITMAMNGKNQLSAQEVQYPTATSIVIPNPAQQTAGDQSLQAWQDYSSQLEQAVQLMQDREGQYQAQIESSNATIMQLQDQINNSITAQTSADQASYFEDEEHEYEEHEYEEHEDND